MIFENDHYSYIQTMFKIGKLLSKSTGWFAFDPQIIIENIFLLFLFFPRSESHMVVYLTEG